MVVTVFSIPVVCHCRMQKYFQSGTLGSSELEVEWTNQHGCGGNEDSDPHKLNCNMVLQYMCQVGGDPCMPLLCNYCTALHCTGAKQTVRLVRLWLDHVSARHCQWYTYMYGLHV